MTSTSTTSPYGELIGRLDGPAVTDRTTGAHNVAVADRAPAEPGASMDLRVGDPERSVTVAELRTHLTAGRLTLDEFDDRLSQALAARTRSQLAAVVRDLPALPDGPVDAPAAHTPRASLDDAGDTESHGIFTVENWRSQVFLPWVAGSVLLTAVWLMSSLAAGRPLYFWVVWPVLGWGFGVIRARSGIGRPVAGHCSRRGRQGKLRRGW